MYIYFFSIWDNLNPFCHAKSILFIIFMCMDSAVVDSLELIDQDYVFVSGPPVDVSTSSSSAPKLSHFPSKPGSPPTKSGIISSSLTAPVPIIGAGNSKSGSVRSLENRSSAPSGTLQGSMDIGDALEQPSTDCMTRIKSLKRCASAMTELVNEKVISYHYNLCNRMTSLNYVSNYS